MSSLVRNDAHRAVLLTTLAGVTTLVGAGCASNDSPPPKQPTPGYYQQQPTTGYPQQTPPGYYQQPAPGYTQQPPPGYYQPQPSPGYTQQPPPPGYTQQPPVTGQPPPQQPAPAPVPTAQQPSVPPPAATSTQLPPPRFGSFDATGSIPQQFMRQEPVSVVGEIVAGLADASRAKVQGIPVQVIEDPKDVNAFAGCSQTGSAFMGVTAPLLLIMARTSEARAFDELNGTAKYTELSNGIASEVKGQKNVVGPPAGFLPLPQALDPRKLARQNFLFDEQVAFVLGHELAHHYRGHTGCANGASNSGGVTPQDIGRVLSSTVPLFNQPNEIEADIQGTFSVLDTGSHRQGGRWTEEGALMVLDFFSRLQSLGVETVVLGFLQTHPPPQIRLPIVQNAAQQWRNNGGKAPVFPFQLPF